jgi:two-component system cell cycle sensor histidine kinase/response regulator CckA
VLHHTRESSSEELEARSPSSGYVPTTGSVLSAGPSGGQRRAWQFVVAMSVRGTEPGQAEATLRESEELFRAIFLQAAVGIAQANVEGEWLLMNDRFCVILGYTRAELRGKTSLDLTHPDDWEASLEGRRRLLTGEISSHSMEKRYVKNGGGTVWAKRFLSLVRDRNNRPQYFITVIEDITDKILAERALRDSEERLRLALSAGLGVWDCDLRDRTVVLSPQYRGAFGHPPLTHAEWLGLVHPDDRERVRAVAREGLERTRAWEAEFRVVWPDGTMRWLLSKATVLVDHDGRPTHMTGVSFDITERKRAEAALRESEERFRNMADTAPVLICTSGPDKLATFFNKGWLDFTGRSMEQELGYGWIEGVHPDDREDCLASYSASFDARRNCHIEYLLRRADGEYRSVVCSGVPRFASDGVFAGYIASCVDITDVKCAQQEALARQKLESMGVLARGIAHDFNNLLGGILASAELALTDSAPVADELQRIAAATLHGGEIVHQLMIYSGSESSTSEPVDISRLIEEMLELLKVSISKHAILQIDLGRDLPAVQANPAQIRQVVMNLVTNASDAIGVRQGTIRISTVLVTISGDSPVREAAKLTEGDYLRIDVSDTGRGMTPEVQARIFDPFFTTKFAGRGLGLSVVQGIVRTHHGTLSLMSEPGQGTTFQVLLPCTAERPQQTPREIKLDVSEQYRSRAGTILVVDDEELLRLGVSKALRKKGYSVIEAEDGSAAMELIRVHKDHIDAVLLDVTLPGLSSREVFEEAHRIRPDLKMILTSAYGKETVDTTFAGLRIEHFIRKPFQLGDLVRLLGDVLSA